MDEYPVEVRIDYPAASSRGWAILTIIIVKFLALIPHGIVLWALSIAQGIAFLVAQVVVLFSGVYPRGLHGFVTGVLRWQTRVSAFGLSLTDKYPPFSLNVMLDYPVDVEIDYPQQSSRGWAGLTVVVAALGLFSIGRIVHYLGRKSLGNLATWLNARELILLPHLIVLVFLGIAVLVLFLIVQWVILVTARYPEGMHDFTAGFMRWSTRVQAWSYGLIDPYPPFTLDPTTRPGSRSAPQTPPPAGPSAGWGESAHLPPEPSAPDQPPQNPQPPEPGELDL